MPYAAASSHLIEVTVIVDVPIADNLRYLLMLEGLLNINAQLGEVPRNIGELSC